MSKNKFMLDILLKRSVSGLLNLTEALKTSTIKFTLDNQKYVMNVPLAKEDLIMIENRVSDKGNLKIKVSASPELRRLVSGVIGVVRQDMIASNEGTIDYANIKPKAWKHAAEKVEVKLISILLKALYEDFCKKQTEKK